MSFPKEFFSTEYIGGQHILLVLAVVALLANVIYESYLKNEGAKTNVGPNTDYKNKLER